MKLFSKNTSFIFIQSHKNPILQAHEIRVSFQI